LARACLRVGGQADEGTPDELDTVLPALGRHRLIPHAPSSFQCTGRLTPATDVISVPSPRRPPPARQRTVASGQWKRGRQRRWVRWYRTTLRPAPGYATGTSCCWPPGTTASDSGDWGPGDPVLAGRPPSAGRHVSAPDHVTRLTTDRPRK